jgi:hypothetical protein
MFGKEEKKDEKGSIFVLGKEKGWGKWFYDGTK